MAMFNVIRFDGLKNREWLIYKYPSEKIVLGSQLIVQEGQSAIFVNRGAVADVFDPGTYTLNTDNLPILNRLVNIPFGGKTPFSAEVYFINKAVRMDIHWGTIDPIPLIDPKYYVRLRVRAFGQMGLKVNDVELLFKEVIGGMPKADIVKFDKIKEYYRGVLVIKAKSAIADAIITNKISALEISAHLEKLSEQVLSQVKQAFNQYGFSVANFYIQSINFPDEDFEQINKLLEDKAAFEIMGEGRYTTKRSFDVYEGAANNQNGIAGAFAAGGIGIGAAVGMGMPMREMMQDSIGKKNRKECVVCHALIPIHSKFCPECGANNAGSVCDCGANIEAGSRFCPVCGKKVA